MECILGFYRLKTEADGGKGQGSMEVLGKHRRPDLSHSQTSAGSESRERWGGVGRKGALSNQAVGSWLLSHEWF